MSLRLEFRRYRLPFRAIVRTAHGPWSERDGVLLRLEDPQGHIGFGEAAPVPGFGNESVDEIETALKTLGRQISPEHVPGLPLPLGCVRFAFASAFAALARDGQIPQASADYLSVAALLPAGKAAIAAVTPKAEAGFRVFKWKVGVLAAADEWVLLDDLLSALPSGAKLRLDANGAWDRRTAERWLERCADRPIEFVEQPVARDLRNADDLLRGLADDYPTPLALDESLVGEADLDRWLGAGWRGYFVIKPSLLAQPAAAIERLHAANARVVFSSALETAVGAQSALRCAFAWKGETQALGFGVWPLFRDSRFDGPAAAPFLRREDVERISPETVWNALT